MKKVMAYIRETPWVSTRREVSVQEALDELHSEIVRLQTRIGSLEEEKAKLISALRGFRADASPK